MKIYVIRHGFTEFNRKSIINGHLDDDLAPEGIEQAEIASGSLPGTIRHIYCSPLKRTRHTAEILNSNLKAPITFHPELMEVDFGELNGQPFTDERKAIHKSQKYDWRPHKGESVADVKGRLLKLLRDIRPNIKSDGAALLVTHGGIMRLMYLLETGVLMDEVQNAALHSFDIDKILDRNK